MKKGQIVAIIVIAIIIVVGVLAWLITQVPSTQQAAINPVAPNTADNQTPTSVSQNTSETTMVVVRQDPKFGSYLADNHGRTLYFFAKDADGKSACSGACLNVWPVFHLASVSLGPGLDGEDFSTVTRDDGSTQTTFYGWPLYYYAGDTAPGDVKGEGINNLWYVAKPDYSVVFENKNNKNYLVDQETGKTIYQFSKDTSNVSNCSGTCIQTWPAFHADKIVAPSFIDLSQFGEITRTDSGKQTTFRHAPLYLYAQDKARGDMKGQGVGGFWSTVDPFATSSAR